MSDRDETDNIQAQKLLDLFEGAKGRRPKTDQELDEWLASPEGKAATAFELMSASRGAKRDGHNGGGLEVIGPLGLLADCRANPTRPKQ